MVLFSKQFLPDFPQYKLRLERFRGKDKAELLDYEVLPRNSQALIQIAMVHLLLKRLA